MQVKHWNLPTVATSCLHLRILIYWSLIVKSDNLDSYLGGWGIYLHYKVKPSKQIFVSARICPRPIMKGFQHKFKQMEMISGSIKWFLGPKRKGPKIDSCSVAFLIVFYIWMSAERQQCSPWFSQESVGSTRKPAAMFRSPRINIAPCPKSNKWDGKQYSLLNDSVR